ncbi:MAG: type II CRISPR RNA-guided endonuclease Cas9 [Sulfurimonas sp.]|jgi:CRISPR-associated endonuclease Csn1
MPSERILGLDITKKRIGWSLIKHNPNDPSENVIVDCGGFDFNAGEIPKTGESPNLPRRNARLARRTIKKRRKRKATLLKLFIESGLIETNDTDTLFRNHLVTSPWDLRAKALDNALNGEELARVLYHIGGRRGYQFTRAEEMDAMDGESGKLKEGGRALILAMEESGARTIGEHIASLDRQRNRPQLNEKKGIKESVYDRSIHRSLLRREIEGIFAAQQALGSTIATNELRASFEEIAFFVPDPQSTEKLLGKCTFYPNETRAVKASMDAEAFVALTRFINCVVEMPGTGTEKKLTSLIELDRLMKMAKDKPSISHADIRKLLNLGDEWIFKGVKYDTKTKKASKKAAKSKVGLFEEGEESQEEIVLDYKYEKKALVEMKAYHHLKASLGDMFDAIQDHYENVVFILTVERGENSITERLKKIGIKEPWLIEALINALDPKIFKETIMLSNKALSTILPQMREGKRYDEAVLELGMPTFEKTHLLPALEKTHIEVNNPIVLRVVAKLRTLVNEIIRFHGAFHKVHIELGRDMSTKAEQKMIDSAQRERETQKKVARTRIEELFGDSVKPSRRNIEKMMLWAQQNEICLYTGKHIELERLYEDGYAVVDYVLPRSRSFDESFGNMVLTFAQEKIEKESMTPFEWFGDNGDKWESFKSLLSSPAFIYKLGRGKVHRLLKENFNDQSATDAASKRLENSRAYAAKVIKELFEDYLEMPKSPLGGKIQVFTRSAWLTAELRRQWIGYEAQHEYDDRISVLNAILVAFSTQNMIQNLSQHFKWKEAKWTKEWLQNKRDAGKDVQSWEKEKKQFTLPYPSFRTDVAELLKYDRSEFDKNGVWRKRLLISHAPQRTTTGQVHDATVLSPKHLKDSGFTLVRGGIGACKTPDIARVDVYKVGDKNGFHILSLVDMAKPYKPNIFIKDGCVSPVKSDNSEFKFSLTTSENDLIGIVDKKGEEHLVWLSSIARSSFQATVYHPDGRKWQPVISSVELKKYTITPLGFVYQVKSEQMQKTKGK